MPPFHNATLVGVTSATAATGGRDDWDAPAEPAGAGSTKWTGEAPAYYRQDVERVVGPNGVDVVEVRELIIDSAVARAAGVDTDDVVRFIDSAGVEQTARASAIAVRELDGIPATLQTTKLELEPA